jgi:Chromo (CHRromatin Organisation MOdifier) domain
MAEESNMSAEESMSEDDISLSTSDSEEEEEYTVETILAERVFEDSSPRYLVKWENYDEERCDIDISVPVPPHVVLIPTLPLC